MKSIKKNFLYNILLNVSAVVFPLITAPYVARVLEPDGIGLINFSGTYAGYFAMVAVLGIPNYGIREVSKIRDDKKKLSELVSQLMSISAIATIGITFVYFLTIYLIGRLNENSIIFLIAGFLIYLAPFKINWYYQGLEEFGYITFRTLVIRLLSIVCLFLLVHEKSDLIVLMLINLFGGIIADVWNFSKMWSGGVHPTFTVHGLKPHMKPLMLLFSSVIAISIYTILDTLMLGFMADYSEVGYYNQAVNLSKTILAVVTSLSVVAIPRVSYYVERKEFSKVSGLINTSFSIISLLAFPCAFGMMCISSVFVPLFFGKMFVGAVIPMMILSALIILIGLNNIVGMQILMGMGLDKLFLYSVLAGTISNFCMNCILIPICGSIGASISSVLAEAIVLFVMLFFTYRFTPIRISSSKDIILSFVGAIMLIPLYLFLRGAMSGWPLICFFIIAGAIVYFIFEYAVKNSSMKMFVTTIYNNISNRLS